MEPSPRISVIIPVYNGECYLAEAIASVLAQTPRPHEIVIVDDGSTDNSAQIVRQFAPPLEYVFQPHAGIGAARNRGVDLARGELLAFLDADDLWAPEKLAIQLQALGADATLEAVFGHVKQFVSPELDQVSTQRLRPIHDIMPGYTPGAMLIKRDSFLRIGAFETRWRVGELIDWYLRATDLGLRSVMLPQVVLLRRVHEMNQGLRQREARGDYVQILKASLDRRRARST